jgi:formiminotetrahydrofolate cyclodeaminase
MSDVAAPDYLRSSLGDFLDAVASREPAPGGGAAAAVAVALAAGLCAMAGRFAEGRVDDAGDLVARAEGLRARVAPLAGEDADAYGRVLAALRLPREPDRAGRAEAVRAALSDAADIPLSVAGIAAEVAEIGADLAERGNANLRGDAVSAAALASAGCQAAAALVGLNLGDSGDTGDDRAARARRLVARAAAAADRALRVVS